MCVCVCVSARARVFVWCVYTYFLFVIVFGFMVIFIVNVIACSLFRERGCSRVGGGAVLEVFVFGNHSRDKHSHDRDQRGAAPRPGVHSTRHDVPQLCTH